MLVCNYCGRNLKKEYDVCPGCGASSFKNISMIEQYTIKKPPKDGYIIKVESYEKSIKISKLLKWIGIILMIVMVLFETPFIIGGMMSMEDDAMFGTSFILISLSSTLIFFLIGIVLIIISIKMKKKALNNIKRVHKLAKEGVLIKNMPYELIPSGTVINGTPIYCIEVKYESKSGTLIPLKSEPKFNRVMGTDDGTVDLLIDANDISNYYIDFEIY